MVVGPLRQSAYQGVVYMIFGKVDCASESHPFVPCGYKMNIIVPSSRLVPGVLTNFCAVALCRRTDRAACHENPRYVDAKSFASYPHSGRIMGIPEDASVFTSQLCRVLVRCIDRLRGQL
jgi:hypothetical protein